MRDTLNSQEKETKTNLEILSGNMSHQIFFYAEFIKIGE